MSRNAVLALTALILMSFTIAAGGQTPPIQPVVQQTPLPPPVEIDAPSDPPADVCQPITAAEAAAIALMRQPDITAARAEVDAASGRVRQAKSGLLPNLNAGASYTNMALAPDGSKTSVSSATAPGYQVTANLRQLIFDFNHTRSLVSQATARQKSAMANLDRTKSDVVLAVKQAFYEFVQNQRLVTVNEANLRNQQSHLASAQARLDSGVGLPADVVRAETAVASAAFNLNLARQAALASRINLATLMGVDPRTPIQTAETGEPEIADDDLEKLVESALENRPEIRQVEWDQQAALAGLNAAKTGSAPSLGAVAGWLQRGSDFPPDGKTLTYGFTVQWTPFDSGLTKGRIQEARADLEQSKAQAESLRIRIINEVSQAYLNLNTAQQRLVTADAEIANAEEALRLVEGRYQSGLGTFLDVLDAQTALLTARTNRVNAQSAVDLARVALAYAIGQPV